MFKCGDCKRQFTPLSGTIFQDTHLPLRKWVFAIYLLTTNGISSNKLAEELGITQKTAWFLVQRIMTAMQDDDVMLSGVIQIDETYVGPKLIGRSSARYSKKYAVMGAVESGKGGKIALRVVKQPDATVAMEFIRDYVKYGSVIHTDESRIYNRLKYEYEHATVNHSERQYVFEGVTSNKIENGWMHGKRLLRGHHIKVSGKHLSAYMCGGYQFRYNNRSLNAAGRLDKWLKQAFGKVLTYRQLKAKRAVDPLALRGWARKRASMPVQMSLF
jgi:hypothetical protein